MSRRDKIIFSLGMVQADSNEIKKWGLCWLLPQRENYFVSSWQISNVKKIGSYPNEKIILSRHDKSEMVKEIAPTPPQDNLVVLSW